MLENFSDIIFFKKKWDCRAVQRSALCRSRRELSNAYLLAKFDFDTAENEPSKVCHAGPILMLRRDVGAAADCWLPRDGLFSGWCPCRYLPQFSRASVAFRLEVFFGPGVTSLPRLGDDRSSSSRRTPWTGLTIFGNMLGDMSLVFGCIGNDLSRWIRVFLCLESLDLRY